MKSLQYLSLLFLLRNEVTALPAAFTPEFDGVLVPVGELASEIDPITDLPHIPLGSRARVDRHAARDVQARALDALGVDLDLDAPVGLDAYKRNAEKGSTLPDGHPASSEILALLARDDFNGGGGLGKRGTFNAEVQLIDVTGEHAFIAPDFAKGDKRGPCPGMNSLANHGYIHRNGLATVGESITAVNKVYGMGLDIGTFLTVYSLVLSGSLLSLNPSYSIGNHSDDVENLLDNVGGLLGSPQGLDGTHNTFEVDGSTTRGDAYDPDGNGYALNITYFKQLYDLQKDAESPDYTLDVIIDNALDRFDQAVAYNPYFYYGPFSGLVLRSGANFFAARLWVNCTAERPDGYIDKEMLKSFYGVTGPDDNLVANPGGERIPDNWYRRPDDYSVAGVAVDLVNMASKNPRILGIGGNVNGVNTYAGINPSDIVGGVLNGAGILEGNNLICFAFQTIKFASPNSLSSIYTTIAKPLSVLFDAIDKTVLSLNCPAFTDMQYGGTDLGKYLLATYPGAAKSGHAL